jgi:hypothetical protein
MITFHSETIPLRNGQTATLFFGDCRDISHPFGITDLITDPPYGQAFSYKAAKPIIFNTGAVKARKKSKPIAGDDVPFDPLPWTRFSRAAIFGAHLFFDRLPKGHLWAWDKSPAGTAGCDFVDCEMIWSNVRTPRNCHRQQWKGMARTRIMEDGQSRTQKLHVSQKPIRALRWVMNNLGTEAGDTVLDPYMGSGSTAVACLAHGVNFVGIEKDPDNYRLAVDRLKNAVREWEAGSKFRTENEAFTLATK